MKKIKLVICFTLFVFLAQAQNGLESIVVEKYYVSNSADSVGSIGVLPAGSVTYRFYVDMLPGYKFQAAYGVPGHALSFTTTTSFFNNEDRGATTPTYTKTQARGNSVMLDSWVTVGAACAANVGILKSEDNVGTGGATVVNNTVPPILQNNDASAGLALTVQDGIYAGTPEAVTFVGITATDLALFDAVSNFGNSFTTSNGSWASLNGSTGPAPSANKVLIAQITTNGALHYELNIQIGTPTGGVENYVATNPVAPEISIPSLMGTLGSSNALPTVSITSPADGSGFITGSIVAIAATAADGDGTVASVEFFVDGVSVGVDNSAPFTANYTSTTGTHALTAKATDNNGGQTTSAAITINVASNPPPTVAITSPTNGSAFVTGTVVAITANASDNGSVASVEFFADGVSLGIDNSSPYTANYTSTSGSHNLTAKAIDNQGAQTTSSPVAINVTSNPPPVISITAPSNGSSFITGSVVAITASANDNGSVASVEFFIDGVSLAIDNSSPYSANYTGLLGTHLITARATDDLGAQATAGPITLNIVSTILPYKIQTASGNCNNNVFCIPVSAVTAVANVIGYDAVMLYNKNMVVPTGVVTVYNSLINPSYVDVANSIDTANGSISLSLYFNASAPANAKFSGTGNVFCVEFSKKNTFGASDTANFSLAFLQESYFTGVLAQIADPGKYISFPDSILKGGLRFWLDNSALRYDPLNPNQNAITNIFGNNGACNSISSVAVQPNLSGAFDYNIHNGASVSIQRDILGTSSVQSVVNGFDAFLTRRVLTNDPTFVPTIYQIIAMDVNLDGVVSSGDLSQINQRAVLLIPEFKQAWNYSPSGVSNGQLSKDWMFIDNTSVSANPAYHVSSTYPNSDGVGYSKSHLPVVPFCLPVSIISTGTCQFINPEFYKGVLVGDINGNFATVGSGGTLRNSNSDKVVFDLANAIRQNGFIDIPVSISSNLLVSSLDFAIKLNSDELEFNSIVDHTNYLQSLYSVNENDQTLRFTSFGLQNYETGKSLLTLRFMFKSENANLSDLNSIEGYLNGEKANVELKVPGGSLSYSDKQVSVFPNPANSILNVLANEDAMIQLMDIDGKTIFVNSTVNANQLQEINVSPLADGIYLMKIFNNNFITIKKVVINK